MKKGLSLLLSFIMVISMFSCLSVVASAATSDYALNIEYIVSSGEEGIFVAPEDGYYNFASNGDGDPLITIYDIDGYYIAEFDDERDRDFYGTLYLEENEAVSCSFHNYRGDMVYINFSITKVENNVASIQFTLADNTVYLNSNGDWFDRWDEELEEYVHTYYYYYGAEMEGNILRVTYNDGSVVDYMCDGYDWCADDGSVIDNSLFIDLTDQEVSPWYQNSENYITVSYFGKTASARVYVVDNPIESISFTSVRSYEFVEYSEDDGYWNECYAHDTNECGEYFHYSAYVDPYMPGNALTVNYTDGRSVEYICTIVGYDETYGEPIFEWVSESGEVLDTSKSYVAGSHDQYNDHWYYGEDCYITITYNGRTCYVPVSIIKNPVKSISYTPVEPYEYVSEIDGYWTYDDWTGEEYFAYDCSMNLGDVLTVDYVDGRKVEYVYTESAYYDEVSNAWYDWFVSSTGEFADLYRFSFFENQNNEHWVLGSDNYITVYFYGVECKVPVYIIENPVVSIAFTPAEPYEFIEHLDGYWDERYNEETDEDEEFFYYQAQDIYEYDNALTVNYTDGSSRVFVFDYAYDEEYGDYRSGWFSADGYIGYFDVSYSMNQYNKPWVVGGNNYFTVEYAGRECQVPVTIKANPVESIEFIPANGSLSVFENTKGYWQGYWDQYTDDYIYTYYEYDFQEIVEQSGNAIKVYYTNGSTSTYYYSSFEDCWINENDELLDYDYLGFWATQYEGNSWTIGNNTASIEYYGKATDVTVKVIEPIDDVTDGKFTAEVINETECHIIEAYESAVVNGVLTIPETIGGYTVTGMDSWLFYEMPCIKEVNLPSGFTNLSFNSFYGYDELEKVNVAENNPVYASRNGVVYNKAFTDIIYCPPCFNGDLYVPAGVEELSSSILAAMGNASSIIIDENNPNFVYEDGIIYSADYTEIIKAVSLPENYVMKSTVKEIGAYAFSGNTTVKNATVSPTVTEISYCAFLGCSALESVAMPEGLVGIGYSAFKNSGLKSIALPSTVEYIDSDAFENCRALASVALNEGLKEIWPCAFANSGVTSVVIPNSVTTVDYKAFYNCNSLTNVVIGSGLTALRGYVFGYCGSLKELNVPATVESIYESAIRGCSSLERINVAADNPVYSSIDGVLFNKNASRLYVYPDGKAGAYTIPSTVNYISSEAFDSASITSVVIPNSVISLGSEAFINCTSLSQVVLSENLTEIDYCTFERCSSLTEINIPASVTYIDGRAFIYCTALKAINVAEANTEYTSENGILYTKDKATLLLAPYGIEGAVVVPQGTEYISAFADCKKVTSIVLPEGLTSIGGAAFSGCTSLTEINIPDTVTSISYMAFEGCSSLESIKLPSSITRIAWSTFEYCENLEAIEIPASVTVIEEYAFGDCESLTDVYYTGTEEQWNAIEIENGNECLTNATIHFNSTMPDDYVANTDAELKIIDGQWVYASGNTIVTDYTGLVYQFDTWFYVVNGILDWNYYGLVNHDGAWFYVNGGVLDWGYVGLALFGDSWLYVNGGMLDWSYTGLVNYNGAWFYVNGGVLDWSYTGLVNYGDAWFYVNGGVLDWSYTGLVNYNGAWFYVNGGVLDWSYTGLVNYGDAWFYVNGGALDWNYTGLVNYGDAWFYVNGGALDWSYTGLANYNGAWFYVNGGVLDWSYTGLANYNGAWFYVNGGVLDWSYTGLVNYGGTWFYVANGVLDWNYTGYVNYYGAYFYITGGVLDWSKQ